ncbi:MAG: DNA polymerase III subunit delta' [Agitococcus sp.]
MSVYPWQQSAWQLLLQSRTRQSLAHAFIVSGVQGLGLFEFCQHISAWLLCQQPTHQGACTVCKSCQLWAAQSHPDYRLIEQLTDEKTGKTSQVIKVDQIRQLIDFLNKSAQLNGYRVAVIHRAETLNINAANSLLKTLEEAGSQTVIILLTESPLMLLPTIRSRCQQISFSAPTMAQSEAWLQSQLSTHLDAKLLLALSEGAPLSALALPQTAWFTARQALLQNILEVMQKKHSALQMSQQWQKQLKAEELLTALQIMLADIMWCKLGQQNAIKNSDLLPIIKTIANMSAPNAILAQQKQCLEAYHLMSANIQTGLLFDNLWLSFSRLAQRG